MLMVDDDALQAENAHRKAQMDSMLEESKIEEGVSASNREL